MLFPILILFGFHSRKKILEIQFCSKYHSLTKPDWSDDVWGHAIRQLGNEYDVHDPNDGDKMKKKKKSSSTGFEIVGIVRREVVVVEVRAPEHKAENSAFGEAFVGEWFLVTLVSKKTIWAHACMLNEQSFLEALPSFWRRECHQLQREFNDMIGLKVIIYMLVA
jgi:hypothetical protein